MKLRMNFTHAAPKKYQAPTQWIEWAQANCKFSGGSVGLTDDPIDAVKNTDFIYTDLWSWILLHRQRQLGHPQFYGG